MTKNEIMERLGVPQNNKDMALDDIIKAVLSANHPDKPKVSDISGEEISLIDETKKGIVTLINNSAPPFYSNIVIATKTEAEELANSIFIKYRFKKTLHNSHTIIAEFYLPDIMEAEVAKAVFLNENFVNTDSCLDILLRLIEITKGIMSVTCDTEGNETSISVFEILDVLTRS